MLTVTISEASAGGDRIVELSENPDGHWCVAMMAHDEVAARHLAAALIENVQTLEFCHR